MSEQQINEIKKELGYMKGLMEGMTSKLNLGCNENESNRTAIDALKNKVSNYEGRVAVFSIIGGVIMTVLYMIIKELLMITKMDVIPVLLSNQKG